MARPPRLKLALLGLAVLLAHLVGLEWFGRQADAISGLRAFVPPMYTRLLKPTTPPPIVAVASAPAATPRDRVAVRAIPAASAPHEPRKPKAQPRPKPKLKARKPAPPPPVEAAAPVPDLPAASEQVAQAPEAAASAPQEPASAPEPAASANAAAASAPQAAASAPDAAASSAAPAASAASAPTAVASAAAPAASAASAAQAAALDRWPVDTRLNYRMDGQWRSGPLFGDARVQWQRQGSKYQVRLDVKLQVFGTLVLTSQGDVTPQGLLPRTYEELRPGKRRVAQMGDEVVTLENGTTVKRPPGVQDTASQFVELSQRFAHGQDVLAVGRTVTVWLARPGGVDQWTYDIIGREMVKTRMGEVEAFHLMPRPLPQIRGNITAEMWFAPALQYLPVRIKVNYGTEAYLDLTADQIEQR